MVLGYSRALAALFTYDQTLESFLRGHVDAFEALGGAARNLVYDNLRSAVLDRRSAASRARQADMAPPCGSAPYMDPSTTAGARYIQLNIGFHGKARTDTHLSMDEGFALRDRLAAGETIELSFRLEVEEPRNIATEYTVATLPGMSDEQIVVMSHTDGYFQAATDNAAGMASALELARFFAARPRRDRPRTMKFIQFPDHHHGEVARGRDGVGIDDTYPWDTVAVKLTMEHPAQTLLYMYNDALTPTNAMGAFRWNALGSAAFEQMVFDTLREFGVSVYALENGPKNGNYAPSFHIIDHVIYHTSLDTPELVPASGLERSTRAFAAALDRANGMTMAELRGERFPPSTGQGRLTGTESLGR